MWDSEQTTQAVIVARMCCRYALGEMTLFECVPYLEKSLDAHQFLELLHNERLLLLVYQVFSGDLKPYVDAQLMTLLSQKARVILQGQLKLMGIWSHLQRLFQAEKIPHILLKGPALNEMLWGRKLMRYSGDLDIFILPKDLLKVDGLLCRQGYTRVISDRKLKYYRCMSRWSVHKDIVYRKKTAYGRIEVHWKTYAKEFIFAESAQRMQLFNEEDYVLYLCLHAAKHGWSYLIWLVDIIAFLNTKNLDVMQLRTVAAQKHILPVVDEAILLAKQWLGVSLVSEEMFELLLKRDKVLKKRLYWGKSNKSDKRIWVLIQKRFFNSSICSNLFYQSVIWVREFGRAVAARFNQTA
ncbi:MAG: nucleotidyltransferase family protein [Legionellaceae bacterium]|nr:nucleotidyltransferase family protein [Legionellaceae bacterium]